MQNLTLSSPKLTITKTVVTRFKRPAAPNGFLTTIVTSSIVGAR